MISYAQNFEDVMLWRALGHIERGFYVDIGAQDPVIDSVSLAFYEHGWRGVHVEPTPAYAEALRSARPDETVVQAAVGESNGLIPFFEIVGTGLSTGEAAIAEQHSARGYAHKRIEVPCIRLSALFDSVGQRDIHWMKIDVEGMEPSVLRGWSPSPARPWLVVVESTLPMSTELSYAAWEPLLIGLGYDFCYFDGLNRFYVSSAQRPLRSAFASPPNVFDNFLIAGSGSHSFCAKLNGDLAQTNRELVALQGRSNELEKELQAERLAEGARARVCELERQVADQQAAAAAQAEVQRANHETLQLLRSVDANRETRAAQVAAAHEQAQRLQAALVDRERAIGEFRMQLMTVKANLVDQQAEQATLREAARVRVEERDRSAELQAQLALDARLGEQALRHREALAAAQADTIRLEVRLTEQRERFDAELAAATQASVDAALVAAGRQAQGRLADQERCFRELLRESQQAAVVLEARHAEQRRVADDAARADLAQQAQRFERQLTQVEAEAARLRADLVTVQHASDAALQTARDEARNDARTEIRERLRAMQAQLAAEGDRLRSEVASARADAAQLQRDLLEQQRDLVGRLEAEHEAAARADQATEERQSQARRSFDAELATARAESRESAVLDVQREMQERLAEQARQFEIRLDAARAGSANWQAQLAALRRDMAAEFAQSRRGPLERWRDARRGPPHPGQAAVVALTEVTAVSTASQSSQRSASTRGEPTGDGVRAPASAAPAIASTMNEPATTADALPNLAPDPFGEPGSAPPRSIEVHLDAAKLKSDGLDLAFRDVGLAVAAANELLNQPHAEIHVLNDLLVLNGVAFVRAAYLTLLKREPDPDGERNYARLLRSGLDKVVILNDMSRSDEGRRAGVAVPGLAHALRRRRLARLPIVGPLLLAIDALFRLRDDHDPMRAFQNQLIDLQRSTLELTLQAHAAADDKQGRVSASIDELRRQQSRLEEAVHQWCESQYDIGASRTPDLNPSGGGSDSRRNFAVLLQRKVATWKA